VIVIFIIFLRAAEHTFAMTGSATFAQTLYSRVQLKGNLEILLLLWNLVREFTIAIEVDVKNWRNSRIAQQFIFEPLRSSRQSFA
jgi:hypothetical protein